MVIGKSAISAMAASRAGAAQRIGVEPGSHAPTPVTGSWVPAFAGMTDLFCSGSVGVAADAVRPVAADGDALHRAAAAVVVGDRQVLDAAVVPERDRPGLPAKPAGELGPGRVGEQEVEQRRALLGGPAVDPPRVQPV